MVQIQLEVESVKKVSLRFAKLVRTGSKHASHANNAKKLKKIAGSQCQTAKGCLTKRRQVFKVGAAKQSVQTNEAFKEFNWCFVWGNLCSFAKSHKLVMLQIWH